MKNRLKLDWALSTSTERNEFLSTYLSSPLFLSSPPNEEELETMANYVLWGKNKEGQNIEQEGLVELPRRNSTWTSQTVESLDELSESPTFNENALFPLNSKLPTKKVREVFSRTSVRSNAPSSLLPVFENLWRQIDEIELTLNYYELEHGKREKEPRKELLSTFTAADQEKLRSRALNINQFTYLKMRHLLVELRREQYTIRDSYQEKVVLHGTNVTVQEEKEVCFDVDVPVFPCGTLSPQKTIIFQNFNQLTPKNFPKEKLSYVERLVEEKQNERKNFGTTFDFEDLESVYRLLMMKMDEEEYDTFSTMPALIKTLDFYIEQAHLTDVQLEILDLKIKKRSNQEIAERINEKFGKTYTINYISTIFRQKIIPAINSSASYHRQLVEGLLDKNNFKICNRCGKCLLRAPMNFVKKARAKDGFSNQCKCCDKQEREEKRKKEVVKIVW